MQKVSQTEDGMAKRIIQWWTAFFLGGVAIVLLCFFLMAILYVTAVITVGVPYFWSEITTDRIEATVTGGIVFFIICILFCMLFATSTFFLTSFFDKGIRGIPPFKFRSFLRWWIGGLAHSTNPSHVLDDFVGFRRK